MTDGTAQFELVRIEDGHGWHKVSSVEAYASPHVQVETAQFLTPSRPDQPVTWSIVHRKAAVAIAPILSDGRFVLLSQERIPVQRALWEFPAGQIDVPVNDVTEALAIETAISELHEEIGAVLEEGAALEPLGYFFPSQGFTQEHVYLFSARVRIVGEPAAVGHEHIHGIQCVTAAELRAMIARNEITTALTLALYAKLAALGRLDV